MRHFSNEHYEVWGVDLEMPLIHHCGYNEWQVAERLSWHVHEGFELVLLLDGQASFEFDDGSRCDLAGGEFFFKLPGQVHRAANDVTSPCKMCWIIFDPEEPDACLNTAFSPTDLQFLSARYGADERKIFTFPRSLKALFDRFREATRLLHSEYGQGNPLEPQHDRDPQKLSSSFPLAQPLQISQMRLLVCQMLVETAMQAQAGSTKKAGDSVAAAIAYMEERFCDQINVDEIADHLGLSRSYLYTVFREGTGQTPNDYLQRTRIKEAESMLEQSSSSVTEIASSLGFSSSQYFSKVFHKYTRQTPQEYRKSRVVREG